MFELVQRKAPRVPAAPRVARSLPIGRVNDPQEHRADSVAEHVMRADPSRPTAPTALSAQTRAPAEMPAGPAPVLGGSGGQPLDPSTRRYFEPRFGSDLGGVRVHSDRGAMNSAAMINARAFALGSDIFYGAGERPGANRLTAHELAHVVENSRSGERMVVRRTPAGQPFEIASPIWNVGGRPVVIVRTSDGRSFFFYRRSGKGSKGAFEAVAPGKNRWVPFEGFQELRGEGRTVKTYRFHKEPYYYGAQPEAGPGYGTQTNKNIGKWLDDTIPLKEVGQKVDWRAVQDEFDKLRPRHSAPRSVTASGQIGGSGPDSSGGGKVKEIAEETTERIRKPPGGTEAAPGEAAPKSSAPETPAGGTAAPETTPKKSLRARLSGMKSGFGQGVKGAFHPAAIAAEVPFVILHFADRAAVQDAIRNIQVKFAKEGFAKGYAAGVAGWSQSEVDSDLKNLVTHFRVKGLGDAGGQLKLSYILQLAEAYENYAVDLGFARSSRLGSRWKEKTLQWAYAKLDKHGYEFSRDERVRYSSAFIDKLAWVLAPTTNQIVQDAINLGDLRRYRF